MHDTLQPRAPLYALFRALPMTLAYYPLRSSTGGSETEKKTY